MKPRVIIADDHALVAEGVTKLLEHDAQIAATVADGRALVQAVEKHNPDLALVDISLPLLNGLDACRQLKKSNPSVKVIILTMHLEKHFVTEAFRAGVSGYVLKQSVTDELLFAIKEVLKGRTYVSPLVTQSLVEQALQPSPSPAAVEPAVPVGNLSLRQREVLQAAQHRGIDEARHRNRAGLGQRGRNFECPSLRAAAAGGGASPRSS